MEKGASQIADKSKDGPRREVLSTRPTSEMTKITNAKLMGQEGRRNQFAQQRAKPSEDGNRESDRKRPYNQKVATLIQEKVAKPKDENMVSIIRLKRIIEDVSEEMEKEQVVSVKRARMPIVSLKFKIITIGAQISAVTRSTYDKLVRAEEEMNIISIRKFTIKEAFSERGSLIANKIRLTFQMEE